MTKLETDPDDGLMVDVVGPWASLKHQRLSEYISLARSFHQRLESTRLAEREIETRRLIAPLAGRSTDIRYVGHHLVFPRAGRQRRALRTFVEWITSELAQTDKKT